MKTLAAVFMAAVVFIVACWATALINNQSDQLQSLNFRLRMTQEQMRQSAAACSCKPTEEVMAHATASIQKCVRLAENQAAELKHFGWAYGRCIGRLTDQQLHDVVVELKEKKP